MQEKTRTANEEMSLLKESYAEDLYNYVDEIDNTSLRYTLLQCRKQLLVWIELLVDTEFAYTKVELQEDFDKLKIAYDNLEIETLLLKANFLVLMDSCKFLTDHTIKILKERDGYYSEWESNRNFLTPRPDWDKCFHLIPNWKALSYGKTSDQLVDLLINEIIHGNTAENNTEYLSTMIINQSEGSCKNMFLQNLYRESFPERKFIINRHMRRRITSILIKDICSNKLFDENKLMTKRNIKLTDYVFDYLTKRFNSKEIAIEISYNMKDACDRYQKNYDINLFWQILTGQIEENVYHYELNEFARILQHFIKLSSNFPSKSVMSTIHWSDFATGLHHLYPHWTNECILFLMNSAKRDVKEISTEKNEFQFLLLFTENDEGHVGEFLMNIRKQLQLDKIEYIEKITDLLIGYPLISINHFKSAVQIVDPRISEEELERYVNWVFELDNISMTLNNEGISSTTNRNIESIKRIENRDFEEIILRLERCSCFMH